MFITYSWQSRAANLLMMLEIPPTVVKIYKSKANSSPPPDGHPKNASEWNSVYSELSPTFKQTQVNASNTINRLSLGIHFPNRRRFIPLIMNRAHVSKTFCSIVDANFVWIYQIMFCKSLLWSIHVVLNKIKIKAISLDVLFVSPSNRSNRWTAMDFIKINIK